MFGFSLPDLLPGSLRYTFTVDIFLLVYNLVGTFVSMFFRWQKFVDLHLSWCFCLLSNACRIHFQSRSKVGGVVMKRAIIAMRASVDMVMVWVGVVDVENNSMNYEV